MFPIQVSERDALLRHLRRLGRDFAAQHLGNCADLPCFAEIARDCPNARETTAQTVLLPTYPRYTTKEAERTAQAVRAFFTDE